MERFNSLTIAAGFGTRMGDGKIPKGLTLVNGEHIIAPMYRELLRLPNLGNIAMVTNRIHFPLYQQWLADNGMTDKVKLIDNGIDAAKNRRGAIGDIHYALRELKWGPKQDVLVMPSDTVYGFPIADYIAFAQMHPDGLVGVTSRPGAKVIANRLGCSTIDDSGRLLDFVEKPEDPHAPNAIHPFYYYPAAVLPMIGHYLKAGGNPDSPSMIIGYFLEQGVPVYAYRAEHPPVDVGTPKNIADAELLLQMRRQ